MKFIEIWKAIIESFGTQGGSLLLMVVILLAFYPLLDNNADSQAWRVETFILGVIAGLINSNSGSKQASGAVVSHSTSLTTSVTNEDVKPTAIIP